MDPSRPNNSQQNQRNNNNNLNGIQYRIANFFQRGMAHLHQQQQSEPETSAASSAAPPESDNDVVMSGTDLTLPEVEPASSSYVYEPLNASGPSSSVPVDFDPSSEPPSRNSARRARVEDEMDIEEMRESNRQRIHSPPTPNQDLPHHFHPHIPHEHHEHHEHDHEHEDPHNHEEEHDHHHHGHGRWVMDQPGGHRVIFDVFVGPPQRGNPQGPIPNLQNLPDGAFVFNLPLGGNGPQGGTAAQGNQPHLPNNLLDHIRQQLANPPPELMQMLAGGLGFGGEEPEDPERAKRLVDGLEEVPIGLVKRLERVGGEDGEGSPNCAVCWESLLDGDGGFEMKEEQKTETAGEVPVDSAGASSSSPPSGERKYPKIVTLPCSHVFHANCLLPWFTRPHRTTCPTCRFDIDPDSLTYVSRRRRPQTNQPQPLRQPPTNEQQAQTQPTAGLFPNAAPYPRGQPPPAGSQPPNAVPQLQAQAGPRQPQGVGLPPAFAALFGHGLNNVVPARGPEPTPVAIPVTLNPGGPPTVLISGTPQNGLGSNISFGPPFTGLGSDRPSSTPIGTVPSASSNSNQNSIPLPPVNPQPNPAQTQNQNQDHPEDPNPTGNPSYLTLDISFVVPIPIPMGQRGPQGVPPNAPADLPQAAQSQPQPTAPPTAAPNNPPPVAPRPIPHGIPAIFGGTFGVPPPVGIGHAFNIGLGGPGNTTAPRPPARPASAPATGQPGSRAQTRSPPVMPMPMPMFAMPPFPTQPAPQQPRPQAQQGQAGSQGPQPQQGGPPNLADNFAAALSQALAGALTDAFAHEALAHHIAHAHGDASPPQAQAPQAQGVQGDQAPADGAPRPPANATHEEQEQDIRDRATQRVFQQLFPDAPAPTVEQIRNLRETTPGLNGLGPLPPLPAGFNLGPPPPGGDNFEDMFEIAFPPFTPQVHTHGPRRGRRSTGQNPPPKPEWTLPPPPGLTLRERVEKREREMGLRCSDISCGLGPSDEDPEPIIDPRTIRQISIPKQGNNSKEQEEYVCNHKFHAACLVSAERVAGYGREDKKDEVAARENDDEDVEVSCPRCRAIGCISRMDWDEGASTLI